MGTSARRWAKGCGCGCGVFVLLLGVVAWLAYEQISTLAEEAERFEAAMAQVRIAHGRIEDYRPDADGAVRPERMEVFLHVREIMAPARDETTAALALLSSRGSDSSGVPGLLGRLLGWGMGAMKIEAGTGLLPDVFAFFSAHGEALLEAGMGPGEYLYIYSIAYFSALGKSPADGPGFGLVGGGGPESRRAGQDDFDIREIRREIVLERVNEKLLPMLRRQLVALDEGLEDSSPWRRELAAEVAALEADSFRIPWRDELPPAIKASIEPYRARLEATYSSMCNPLEVQTGDDN